MYARTVESFPPDAATATVFPGSNNFALDIVKCISVSKASKKHSLHSASPVFGRYNLHTLVFIDYTSGTYLHNSILATISRTSRHLRKIIIKIVFFIIHCSVKILLIIEVCKHYL